MNMLSVKQLLLDLKGKQYIESDITHTIRSAHQAPIEVSYIKVEETFCVTFDLKHSYFTDVDEATMIIYELIQNNIPTI